MDTIVKTLTRPVVALCLSILVLLISCVKAVISEDPGWFASAGAMITLFGILLTTRSLLRFKSAEEAYQYKEPNFASLPSLGDEKGAEKQRDKEQQKIRDISAERCGFWFLVVGTFIWAYGDRVFSYMLCAT